MKDRIATKDRLILALDTDDLSQAISWADCVKNIFGTVKVGLQLFSTYGPSCVEVFLNMGFEVFLDLKFHDIPITVEKSSRAVGSLGISLLTVHGSGGADMVAAAKSGLVEGAESAGQLLPKLLGVTVLTSLPNPSVEKLHNRVSNLLSGGADGLVCGAPDLSLIETWAPDLMKVVPGIRRENDGLGDQARVATPARSISWGADMLVIGRPITEADDPKKEANIFYEMVDLASK